MKTVQKLRSLVLVVVFLTLFAGRSEQACADQSLPDYVNQVTTAVKDGLIGCGIQLVETQGLVVGSSVWDSRYIMRSRSGYTIGYFVQTYDGPAYFRWVNANQANDLGILFTTNYVSFTLPDRGTVASASRRFNPPLGMNFSMTCRGVGVVATTQLFEACVKREFIDVSVQRICAMNH
jgi:hypothetical protein